jgi:hypothetical protein
VFDTKLNFGAKDEQLEMSHLEIGVQANDPRWLESQASTVREWIPIPELTE